jgi:SAM-dependent methyltransferase
VVAAIYAAADARLDLTVIDRCETPLRIVAWWAERSGRAVNMHKGAITSYVPDEVFDLVCTDAFLGLFDADARVGVVRRWRDALRPGGKAVTTFRVRRRREGADARAARREETARTAAARAAADPSLGLDAGEAAQSVRTYFERHKTHAIASVAEIERLFVDSGFAVDAIAGPMPGYVTLTATRR